MRWIISCFILLFWCSVLKAQSFYELQYHMPWQKETIPCKAFLVRNEDGSGFVRVKYKKPGIPQEILLQMSIEDELHMNPDGSVDTTNLFVKTREPESISDQFEEQPFLPVYGFIFEEESQTWEPRLLLSHNPDGSLVVEGQAQLKAENMSFKQLTRSYLSNYFSPDDEFVKNLLEPNTRSISATERGIQLHLLIVANTNDSSIGSSCALDIKRMVESFSDIVNFLGLPALKPVIISGAGYNKGAVIKTIQSLKPSPQDIVVFYYSGHGYRNLKEKRKFPYIDLRANPAQDYRKETLNMEDIYTMICKKGARCNIVLSDCCNTVVEQTNVKAPKPMKTKTKGKLPFRESNIRELFLSPEKVNILATAADTNQRASSNDQFGGFYSYFFRGALEKRCSILSGTPSWYQVLDEAREATIQKARRTYCDRPFIPANICDQIPQRKIE